MYNKLYGPRHHATLACMNNLACVLASTKQWQDAHAMYSQCLEGFKELLGPTHAQVTL